MTGICQHGPLSSLMKERVAQSITKWPHCSPGDPHGGPREGLLVLLAKYFKLFQVQMKVEIK